MKNLKRAGALALCAAALAIICLVTQGGLPQGQAAAPPGQPGAAAKPYALSGLPESWGNPRRAGRPAPAEPAEAPRSTAVVALPPAVSLARMPAGRVVVGEGRVDPARAMRHRALYVITAQAPGIVEYLYSVDGLTRLGMPLVRLYDLNILSDLKIGESAMARFASSPFVIAGRSAGLPPVPPSDFPKPTALQRLLGIRPTPVIPAPQQAAQAPSALAPRPQLSALAPRSGLSRASGLAEAPAPAAVPAPAPAPERPARAPSVRAITRLSGEMSDLHDRMAELNKDLAAADDEISAAQDKLAEAKDDAAARERLYNQGVLARNVYEGAKARLAMLTGNLEELQQKRSELVHARELLLQRIAAVQEKMDDQVAEKAQAAATLAARDEQPRGAAPQVLAPRREPRTTLASRPAPARVAAAPAPAHQSWFPSPVRRPRPELQRLPRLAGAGIRTAPEIPAVPSEVKRLAAPRWVDQAAPGDGLVVRQLAPEGAQVQPGTPLLEVANREWARVYSDVATEDVGKFPKGAPVRVSFDSYPGVTLEGWINDVQPLSQTPLARVEMVVMAREGYCPDDTYASLEWLVLAAPIVEQDRPEALQPAVDQRPAARAGYAPVYSLLPLVPPQVGPGAAMVEQTRDDEFVGLLRLGEVDSQTARAQQKPEYAKRLAALHKWRESFTAGMTTGIFGNLVLTYPRDNEIGKAVEKMATARVSHESNRCARTMREALGWGLGDAAVWMTRLPERGYRPRQDGLARPGDILVWPFTYGPRRSQHIGVAVSQAGKLMLLSNLGGTLGTTELLGGYVAFYRPDAPQVAIKCGAAAPRQQ